MGRYADAAAKAAELTNKQLGKEISSLSILQEKDLNRLMRKKEDRKNFLELMSKVESEVGEAEKTAYLSENITQLAPVILKTLKFFA